MAEIVRHIRTGGLYEVLHRGAIVESNVLLADYAEVIVCRRVSDGGIVARPGRLPLPTNRIALYAASVQTTAPLTNGDEVAVYRGQNGDALVWVRPTSEMDDGRFEPADTVGAPRPAPDPRLEAAGSPAPGGVVIAPAPETTLPGGEVERLIGIINEYAEAIRMHERNRLRTSVEGVEAANWWEARWKHTAERLKDALLAGIRSSRGGEEKGASSSMNGLSQVEPASGLNPSDFDPSRDDSLNARLKAAGMYSIPEMMGVTPLTRWMVHVGMTDLDFFAAWLDRRVSQFLRMKAGYELGDKDKGDELYEWVGAHSAAFSEARENFRAVRAAMAAQAMEARQGGDAEGGSVEDDSAVRKADVPVSIDQVLSSTPARQEEGSRGGAPDGWVLVPREPTAGMMLAARDHHSRETAHEDHRISIYRAMLSASPSPDATSGGEAAGRDDQTAQFIAESDAIEQDEAMRQENRRLRIALHDAIRRPLGVTPDSALEFYDPRMADEAEARRADGGGCD